MKVQGRKAALLSRVIVAKYDEDELGWVSSIVPRNRVLVLQGNILRFGGASSIQKIVCFLMVIRKGELEGVGLKSGEGGLACFWNDD